MFKCPVVKILARSSAAESFYAVSGSKILLKQTGNDEFIVCSGHPEGKKWSSIAALSSDEKFMAVCDCEKNLFLYEIKNEPEIFELQSVPMHLAKTATSVKFTDFPAKWTILVADKFGDVLRFQVGEEFDRWAKESRKNSKSLSIHTKSQGKRSLTEATEEESVATAEEEESGSGSSEAHHCTIIGHISMVTDLQVLPIYTDFVGGLIVSCDRDEKVRLTRADRPELIHSFGLIHKEFVGTLTTCEATKSVFSAGGDNFIAEWQVEGSKLNLKSKIELEKEITGVVQEIKINQNGNLLFAHIDKFGLLCYKKTTENGWILSEKIEIRDLTAFDLISETFYAAIWSPETVDAVSFKNCGKNLKNLDCFDEISEAEGKEIVEFLSKAKLRKDIERIDWKQKKHANQKPREILNE